MQAQAKEQAMFFIVDSISNLEAKLRSMGSHGKGIKELINNIKFKDINNYDNFNKIVPDIKFCNHIRNEVVHERKYPNEISFNLFKQKIDMIMIGLNLIVSNESSFASKNNAYMNQEEFKQEDSFEKFIEEKFSQLPMPVQLAGGCLMLAGAAYIYYKMRD